MKSLQDYITESASGMQCELLPETGMIGGVPSQSQIVKFNISDDAQYIEIADNLEYINFYSQGDIEVIDEDNDFGGKFAAAVSKLKPWDKFYKTEDGAYIFRIR